MAPLDPGPSSLTIRLKHQKLTILLHANQTTSLTDVKTELLRALTETTQGSSFNSGSIPTDVDDVLLAKPQDNSNLNAGWISLQGPSLGLLADGESSVRQGKRKVDNESDAMTLRALDIKDNAVLAFRFRSSEAEADESFEEEDGVWDVTIPSYEDSYEVDPNAAES